MQNRALLTDASCNVMSLTLICKNAYLMKIISLNNVMHLFTVNRSTTNCINVFIILDKYLQMGPFFVGFRLKNDSKHMGQPNQQVERDFILRV